MKLNLIILTLLVCFGSIQAQTTAEKVVTHHGNTIELHIATKTIDPIPIKTYKINEVSKYDADNYVLNDISVARTMVLFSVRYGFLERQKIVAGKDGNLHYENRVIPRHNTIQSAIWLTCIMAALTLLSMGIFFLFKKEVVLWAKSAIIAGVVSSLVITIDNPFSINWDEKIGPLAVGICIAFILVITRQVTIFVKKRFIGKIKPLQPIH